MANKFTALFGAQDMTRGNVTGSLVKFSVPLLIGNMAQLLYTTVDSIIVGTYVGDEALAAIGASNPIVNLLLLLLMGISMGGSIMVSQYFGAQQRDKLSATVGTMITWTMIATVFMMITGGLFSRPLLNLLSTPDDIFDMTLQYLLITFMGIIGPAYYNILSGILRGLGDALTPLVFLLIATGLNIGLDIWFVAGLNMSVAGVAWATAIAQFVSAVLCMIRILSMKDVLDISTKLLKPDGKLSKQLFRLGMPSGITQGIFSMAALVVQGLTNSFGTMIIAVSNVVMRVDSFAMIPTFTFGTAMTTFTGQNLGAGNLKRVEKGARKGMWLGLSVSAVLVLLILIFGEWLMGLFTQTEEVIEMGSRMLRLLAVGYLAMCLTQILSGVMRGAGSTMPPMWISIITTVVIRVPLAYGLAWVTRSGDTLSTGAPESIFISMLISWILGAILTVVIYARGRWKNKSIVYHEKDENTASAEAETMNAETPIPDDTVSETET